MQQQTKKPSIFPSIRVFSNESALRIRWPKYWSYSISPSNGYSLLLLFNRSVVFNSAKPWSAAHQASLCFTISQSLLKLMSIESVMPVNHLILCRPLLLLLSIFPSIRVFSNESTLPIR